MINDERWMAMTNVKLEIHSFRNLQRFVSRHRSPTFRWFDSTAQALPTTTKKQRGLPSFVVSDPKIRSFLGGGFKYFLFSPILWEGFPFWVIFFNWVETTNYIFLVPEKTSPYGPCDWCIYIYIHFYHNQLNGRSVLVDAGGRIFTPNLGDIRSILTVAFFSDGLVQPPTRKNPGKLGENFGKRWVSQGGSFESASRLSQVLLGF